MCCIKNEIKEQNLMCSGIEDDAECKNCELSSEQEVSDAERN